MFFSEQIDFSLFEFLQVKVITITKVFKGRIVFHLCCPYNMFMCFMNNSCAHNQEVLFHGAGLSWV